MSRWIPGAVAALLAAGIWLTAAPAPARVAGRLGYVSFLGFSLLCAVALASTAVALAPARWRRPLGLRVCTVALGVGIATLAVEVACWLIPAPELPDNPFYLSNGTGFSAGGQLAFVRPPGLHWTGLSRGDLAAANGDEDPYARTVTFETDFEGFRNPRDMRRADVVVLGDSHTEAGNVPVEDSFAQQLAARLGRPVRVLAVAGYAPSQELVVLREIGVRMRPRVVVWQLSEANDLGEEVRYRRWLTAGRPRTENWMRAGEEARTRRRIWEERSPSWKLVRALRAPRKWPMEARLGVAGGETLTMRFLAHRESEIRPRANPGWPLLRQALSDGARVIADAGAVGIVLLVPTKLRVTLPLLADEDWVRGRPVAPPIEGPESFAGRLGGVCARAGLRFVDPTAALVRRARQGEPVFQPLDTHLSAAGHGVVTDLLAGEIEAALASGGPPVDESSMRASMILEEPISAEASR